MRSLLLLLSIAVSAQAMPVATLSAPKPTTKVFFDETYLRFHGLFEIPMHLRSLTKKYRLYSEECNALTPQNFAILGGVLPSVEKPVENQPGAFYMDLYVYCMHEGLYSALSEQEMSENFTFMLGGDAIQLAKKVTKTINPLALDESVEKDFLTTSINLAQDAELREITERAISHVVGPRQVWQAAGLVGEGSVIKPAPANEEELITTAIAQATADQKSINIKEFIVNVMVYVRVAMLRG